MKFLSRAGLIAALVVATALTGCAAESAPAPAASESVEPDVQTNETDASPETETEGADPQENEQRFGIGLEKTGEVIRDTLENASGFTVEGTTLTVTFSEGDVGFDGMLDCLSTKGLMGDGETLILEYPDGSTEC